MKALILSAALALSLSLAGQANAARYGYVTESGRSALFINLDKLNAGSSPVTVWSVLVLFSPELRDGKTIDYTVEKRTFDCQAETSRAGFTAYYAVGQDSQIAQDIPAIPRATPIIPDSNGSKFLDIACGRKSVTSDEILDFTAPELVKQIRSLKVKSTQQ